MIEINTEGDPYIDIYTDDGIYEHYKGYNKDDLLLSVLEKHKTAKLSPSGKSITIKQTGKTAKRSNKKTNSILKRAMELGGFKK